MIVALYILCALVVAGVVLKLTDRRHGAGTADGDAVVDDAGPSSADADGGEECCGMHITCERDSLLAAVSDKIEYFDDEELDAFAGRGAADYDDGEIEQFRDVLLTLLPEDIAPWARSIQLRGINLPEPVRDELLMLVAEARAKKHTADEYNRTA